MSYVEYKSIDEYCKNESSDSVLYINTEHYDLRLSTMLSLIVNHFNDPDCNIDNYIITSDEVQFRCYSYDLYDDDDYGNVIIVEKVI